MRLEIFDCDQVFSFRLRESFPKIDNDRTAQINLKWRFLDRFALCVEMKSCVGVGAVVHTHFNRAKIDALAFRYRFRQLKMKRFVTRPFRQLVRKRS